MLNGKWDSWNFLGSTISINLCDATRCKVFNLDKTCSRPFFMLHLAEIFGARLEFDKSAINRGKFFLKSHVDWFSEFLISSFFPFIAIFSKNGKKNVSRSEI